MVNMMELLNNIRLLDELAGKRTNIHQIHPLMKVLTTLMFLFVTVSFDKYQLSGLLPLIFYPVVVITLADIPVVPILKRMLFVMPFIIGIGVFNPFFDTNPVVILPWIQISGGWISFFSILVKGSLTILAALLLIATTGITRVASALRMMRIPKVFIMQLLLTYRYITLLIEEVGRALCAYSLRSPDTKGIKISNWGSLTGQLLMRTLERAQRVYHSMCCRGFTGEYRISKQNKMMIGDIAYFAGWSLFFVIVRFINIPAFLGLLMTGEGR
ncbi:MAG: cobalt ECF transporter T component CbiQ [Bacillota bacterium]